jgi:fructose 5-dehydrogenase small subunit
MDRLEVGLNTTRLKQRIGSTRRSLLLGTAASIASVGLSALPWPAQAQQAIAADSAPLDDEGFLKLSRLVTGHADLSSVTATRIFTAMRRADPNFAAHARALARLAHADFDAEALLGAAESTDLHGAALAIVSAWYTGTVGKGPNAVLVSYVDALMHRPVSDGLTVPTYCSNGPLWWTIPPPSAGVAPPSTTNAG